MDRVTDVAVMAGGPHFDTPEERLAYATRHFTECIRISDDLWIGPLGKWAEEVMDACTPEGQNSPRPVRQYGSRYAFIRANAPAQPVL